jgi:chromosome segregation ATPase
MTNDVTTSLRELEQKSEGLGREVRRLSHALASRDSKIEVLESKLEEMCDARSKAFWS